jgi:hypothetical protein
MKVLVCGGRDFDDWGMMCKVMCNIKPSPTIIIHGAARGADRMAGDWARANGLTQQAFPADWNQYGKTAGMIRNAMMLKEGEPDLVVAFPGGRGTADMVRKAKHAGVRVIEVNFGGENEVQHS